MAGPQELQELAQARGWRARLEKLAGMRAIAFDKTGTLTPGEPQVTYLTCRDCVREDGHRRKWRRSSTAARAGSSWRWSR